MFNVPTQSQSTYSPDSCKGRLQEKTLGGGYMQSVLENYVGQEVGVNYDRPFQIEPVILVRLGDDYFSIQDNKAGDIHHYSYSSIVQVVENPGGVQVKTMFTHSKTFPIVIKVAHLVDYMPT